MNKQLPAGRPFTLLQLRSSGSCLAQVCLRAGESATTAGPGRASSGGGLDSGTESARGGKAVSDAALWKGCLQQPAALVPLSATLTEIQPRRAAPVPSDRTGESGTLPGADAGGVVGNHFRWPPEVLRCQSPGGCLLWSVSSCFVTVGLRDDRGEVACESNGSDQCSGHSFLMWTYLLR